MAFVYTGAKVDLGAGRGWLNAPAAASIRRIDRQIGHPLQITEAGRDWAKQNEHYQRYLRNGRPIALSPNAPSIHQKGGAIDTDEGQRIHAVMEDHGWRRTVYRGGKLVEPWHYEYFPQHDNRRNEPAGGGHAETPVPASTPGAEMYIIRAEGRTPTLVGPGYARPLTTEEASNIGAVVSKDTTVNPRQFDLAVSVATTGTVSGPAGSGFIASSPNRKKSLFGAGFVRELTPEEEGNAAGLFTNRTFSLNDRQFDLAASIALTGQLPKVPVAAEVDIDTEALIKGIVSALDYAAIAKAVNDDAAKRLQA